MCDLKGQARFYPRGIIIMNKLGSWYIPNIKTLHSLLLEDKIVKGLDFNFLFVAMAMRVIKDGIQFFEQLW